MLSSRTCVFLLVVCITLPQEVWGFSSMYRRVAQPADLASNDVSWQTLVGQADRAFKLGTLLEKNGQYRKASSSFHEAATLYQCYLENGKDFRHVTELTPEGCLQILSYTLLRLGFLNLDCLGDSRAAVRLYREAANIDPMPSASSYEGIANSIEASGGSLEDALENYQKAIELQPSLRRAQFRAAVILDRLGRDQEASDLLEKLRRDEAQYACLVDSWGYVRWHTRKMENINLSRGSFDMLELALTAAMPLVEQGGLVCEFGVGSGRSMRMTQEILPLGVPIHGFDTFSGLPQAWGDEPAGTYSTGGEVPMMDGAVFFHKGLFSETLGPFLKEVDPNVDGFTAYVNVDCDLYSSTLDILENLHGRIVPGTIVIFDEYIGHQTWRQDEFRAWRECCKRFGWKYEYLAFSLSTKQAIVRVTDA